MKLIFIYYLKYAAGFAIDFPSNELKNVLTVKLEPVQPKNQGCGGNCGYFGPIAPPPTPVADPPPPIAPAPAVPPVKK